MYSGLKKAAAVTIILAVINAISAILTYLTIVSLELLDAISLITVIAIMGSSSIIFLLIGISLWQLHGDLEAHMDTTFKDISALRKRIDALENKIGKP